MTIERIKQKWELMLERRSKAVESLLASLAHLPIDRQYSILTSRLDIETLEALAEFNKR